MFTGIDTGSEADESLRGDYVVECRCGCYYAFPHKSRGHGWEATAIAARKAAAHDAAVHFVRDVPLVTCPRCGRFAADLVDAARWRRQRGAVRLGWTAIVAAFAVFGLVLALFRMELLPVPHQWHTAYAAWQDDGHDDGNSGSWLKSAAKTVSPEFCTYEDDEDPFGFMAALGLGFVTGAIAGFIARKRLREAAVYDPNNDPQAQRRARHDAREVTPGKYRRLTEAMLRD